jgi:feruloyl-CoA synthase
MTTKPPFNRLRFAEPQVDVERRDDGTLVLRSPHALQAYPGHLGHHLRRWAGVCPDRIFLAERDRQGGWRTVRYREMLGIVESIGQALLEHGLSAQRPLMVLSENSIDLAAMTLAGQYVGVPVVPVSPAYSLMSQSLAKLRAIAELVAPGMIYARDEKPYARAIEAIRKPQTALVTSEATLRGATSFAAMLGCKPTRAVGDAFDGVNPDDTAKILFTSGSTGEPKGVITTHRMLCANQQSIAQCWPFLEDSPPVIVDWLPWSHAFGANHNFNLVLRNAGTLYIDGGKPVPGLIDTTVRNLREISPTILFNAPRGFDMLLPYLEHDAELRESVFRRLDLLFYAGAVLPESLWDRLEAVSIRARGERVRIVSSWGSTETTCTATCGHQPMERTGIIGIPAPGVEVMLRPSAAKMELRVRGTVVTPGYWKRPDLTEAAFDAEGFYKIGDAGRLDDADDPSRGIVFDGRVAEDFKLLSGTWVHCGQVRVSAIAAASPAVQDAVVTGRDRASIGLLVFLNAIAARAIADDASLTLAELAQSDKVRAHVARGLRAYNDLHGGSSTRIARFMLMPDLPSIDHGEITDKGYINQRAVSEQRAHLIDRLYADPRAADVLLPAVEAAAGMIGPPAASTQARSHAHTPAGALRR